MATANASSSPKSGTWLVVGLLALATIAVIVSRVFYFSPDSTLDDTRKGMALSQEGKKLLPIEEQRELDTIYAEAFKSLSEEERRRFMTLGQKGTAATDDEIIETATLIGKALRSLSPERGARLGALVNKAVQLAQQKVVPSSP
jgi:hypothetical protein